MYSAMDVSAQGEHQWWNDIHQWDGVTPWQHYLTISPSYFGPNALPVPETGHGIIDSTGALEAGVTRHFSKGDKTTDTYVRGYLPLYNNRMAVQVHVNPYEVFEMDSVTRDERAARTRSGKGNAGGDIYLSAIFQLIRNRSCLPEVALQVTLRTASGTNLGNARYTDIPGYYTHLSFGKTWFMKPETSLRFYAMGGLYVYQTFDVQHLQNDAFLFGGGADFRYHRFTFSASAAGYNGYLNIGDKPLVVRSCVVYSAQKFDWKLFYQYGINDYPYSSVRLSAIWKFRLRGK